MSLEVRLAHAFGTFRLDAAFEAPPGVTALFGRSGSGKTTVVSAVAGLLRPQSGRIAIDGATLLDTARGVDLPPHRRRVGYVFQEGRLFPHLTVRQNLRFGAWFAPRAARSDPRRTADAAAHFARVVDLLGVAPLLDRRPGRLSGGEKQRVAVGRALLSRPNVLLMDEPLAALDEARKAEILPYLERLRDETRIPIVYVSHSVAEVARLATTVVALADGRVEAVGPPADLFGAAVAGRLVGREKAGAILQARVVGVAEDGLTELAVSGGRLFVEGVRAGSGASVRLRIRASDVILATEPPRGVSALNLLPATVEEIAGSDGPSVEVGLRCGDDRLLARITRRSLGALALAPGSACFALVKTVAIGERDPGPFGGGDA